jgi:hypothetical protein
MTAALPPPLWQRDLIAQQRQDVAEASSEILEGGAAREQESDEKLSDSWRHVKQVAREVVKGHDLLDLLQNTRREETYQFPVPGVSGAVSQCSCCWHT